MASNKGEKIYMKVWGQSMFYVAENQDAGWREQLYVIFMFLLYITIYKVTWRFSSFILFYFYCVFQSKQQQQNDEKAPA